MPIDLYKNHLGIALSVYVQYVYSFFFHVFLGFLCILRTVLPLRGQDTVLRLARWQPTLGLTELPFAGVEPDLNLGLLY
jgi:hypothetical protein